MSGLWLQIKKAKFSRDQDRLIAAKPSSDARDAHEAGARVKQLDAEIVNLRERAITNERAIAEIGEIIARLEDGEGSRDRSIAIRCLEDAAMRLARENGEKG